MLITIIVKHSSNNIPISRYSSIVAKSALAVLNNVVVCFSGDDHTVLKFWSFLYRCFDGIVSIVTKKD